MIKFSRSRSGAPSASPASPGGLGVLAGVAGTPTRCSFAISCIKTLDRGPNAISIDNQS
ncbi:hypothetical protein PF005_g25101 [Phytophthora fragariae]|uniref:Uncharacterized protein n=1 Tax=Phytophthora fragariae TaxID=53985 RepID=A0A6A3DQX4_9STRA|nr:hypothetical protein PF009_g25841 [Phytophthora fragariae]KAE9075074.1 hypothetical protein PF007_g25145 [Phytophthora fragariae]KAE9093510.1 hypothetical protein PF006_g24423 [Phytophthora fragariae]KAE9176118.1 hypothetical protein PF005_g25101 [Phytophthora fragariae]KAE9177367.1 hypothetical protein PF002_g28358 [Phytophthora fragariae]